MRRDAYVNERVLGAYALPLIVSMFGAGLLTGAWHPIWPALIILVAVPVADRFLARDTGDLETGDLSSLQRALLSAAPQIAVLSYLASMVIFLTRRESLEAVDLVSGILSAGILGSLVFTACHDLIHRSHWLPLTIGRIGLATLGWTHFEPSHLRGHHVRVRTPEDKSTAWSGESAYAFVLRAVPDNYRLSWQMAMQSTRLRRLMVGLTILQAVVFLIVWLFGSLSGLLLWLAVAVVAMFLAEVSMYIAHYGVIRLGAPGHYERQQAHHAWDSYHRLSSHLMFGAPRHASHHLGASIPYWLLRTQPNAHQMPSGYPFVTMTALIPPIWRRIAAAESRIDSQ